MIEEMSNYLEAFKKKAPESLKSCKSCFGFCYACSDVVVSAGIFCDDDSKVSDLLFDFDLWRFLCVRVRCAMLWVEVDWSRGVLPNEFALACVEFEVVLRRCALDGLENSG